MPDDYNERIKKLTKRASSKGPNAQSAKQALDKVRTKQYDKRFNQPAKLPDDAQYITDVAAANRNRNVGMLGTSAQINQTENEYGFGTDTSNPYSRAALLEQSFQQTRRGTNTGYAAAGQFYSGALQRAQDYNLGQYGEQTHFAQKDYLGALNKLIAQQTEIGDTHAAAMDTAESERLSRAAAEEVTDAPKKPKYVKRHTKNIEKDITQYQKRKRRIRKKKGKGSKAYERVTGRLRKKKQEWRDVPNEYEDKPEGGWKQAKPKPPKKKRKKKKGRR